MNQNDLFEKWKFLVDELNVSKQQKIKYSKVLEKTVKYNDKHDLKMLLSILIRVFKKYGNINLSNGKQHSIYIGEFYDLDFYLNDIIMIDQFMAFCDVMSDMIVSKLNDAGKIAYLEIKKDDERKKINLIY